MNRKRLALLQALSDIRKVGLKKTIIQFDFERSPPPAPLVTNFYFLLYLRLDQTPLSLLFV